MTRISLMLLVGLVGLSLAAPAAVQDPAFQVWVEVDADGAVGANLQRCIHQQLNNLPDVDVVLPPLPSDPSFETFVTNSQTGIHIMSLLVQETGETGYAGSVLVMNYYESQQGAEAIDDVLMGHWLMLAQDVPQLCAWTVDGLNTNVLEPERKLRRALS